MGNRCALCCTGKLWRLEADGKRVLVLVLAWISLHVILLLVNCTDSANLAAPSRDGGVLVPSGLVGISECSC